MMWLYVGLVAVVCAAVPGTVWLKRAGEAEWRAHRIRVMSTPMVDAFGRWVFDLTPMFQQLARELTRMAEEMRPALNSPAMRKLARDIARMQRGGRS